MNFKKRSVTVEDLIRIKRAERPPGEFWAEFEREMRLKQLAAIVEPRPWWAPLIRVRAKVAHYQLPIGAAAIVALSFLTVGEYRSANFAPTFVPEITAPASEVPALASLPVTPERIDAEVTASNAARGVSSTTDEEISSNNAPAPASDVAHTGTSTVSTKSAVEPARSTRFITADLAATQAADPRILDEVFGVSAPRTELVQPVRDPLAQISSPGESRRSRLLATSLPLPANSTDISVGTSDRVARHLTEERLYDSISRVGVRGDRVAIRF